MPSQELLCYEMAAVKMRRWKEDGLSPLEGVAELVRELDNTNGWYGVCKTELHHEQERREQAEADRDRLAAERDEYARRVALLVGTWPESSDIPQLVADCNRFAAALEQIDSIVRQRRGVSDRIRKITREALGSTQTTQEPA